MKKYLVLSLLVLSFALAGCPKEEPAPVDAPDKGVTDQSGVKEGTINTPK